MTKYEEALTQLVMYAPIEEEPIPSQCYETLGELIDNYSKLEKALDKAIYWLLDSIDKDIARFKTKEEWKEWLLKDE